MGDQHPMLTVAQFRMLGRAIRGEILPVARFRIENPTVAALVRKGCWVASGHDRARRRHEGHWVPTAAGRDRYAAKGRPVDLSPERFAMRHAAQA